MGVREWHLALVQLQRPRLAAGVVLRLWWEGAERELGGTLVVVYANTNTWGQKLVESGGVLLQLSWSLVPSPVVKAAGFVYRAFHCEPQLLLLHGCYW